MSEEAKIMAVPKIYSHKMIIDFAGLQKVLEIYANGTERQSSDLRKHIQMAL